MSVISQEELMNRIRERIGEDTSDDTLQFVEDLTDTINDMASKAKGDGVDWKQKYEENDKKWKEKFRDRFFEPRNNNDGKQEQGAENVNGEREKPLTYENLFITKG